MSDEQEPEPRIECSRCHKRFDLSETYSFGSTSACMDCVQDEIDEVTIQWNHARFDRDRLRAELEAVAAPLETLLVEVEPALAERRSALEAHCTAVQNWADAANAKAENGRIWCYLSEHRARLEREHEPLREAVGNANRALDALRAALAKGGQGGE